MLLAKYALLEKVIHNVLVLLFNGQGQTCVTTIGLSKLPLTKYWNEVLHQFQAAKVSSKV